jgi:hypothetical protein
VEGFEILIDNRKDSYLGGRSKEFIRYGKTIVGAREFKLAEGSYVLSVRRGRNTVKNFQFAITSNRTTELQVSYDLDSKEIDIY